MKTPPTRPNRPPPPPPSATAPLPRQDLRPVLLGTVIAVAVVFLLLLLLVSAYLARTWLGRGNSFDAGDLPAISAAGDPDVENDVTGGLQDSSQGLEGESAAEQDSVADASEAGSELATEIGSEVQPEPRVPPTDFSIQRINVQPEVSSSGSNRSRRNGRGKTKTLAGVKVKGAIALVCDVSGSMASDYPKLVKELRRKFPSDTPLILIPGCSFNPPNPNAPPPHRLIDSPMRIPYIEAQFKNDPHVFWGTNTTDAIIFAVKELGRDTVMFNNDLQDGGSERAIDAFEKLNETHPFALSGRSLECDAPSRLREFIRKSGGDFKVDPIFRRKSSARMWSS